MNKLSTFVCILLCGVIPSHPIDASSAFTSVAPPPDITSSLTTSFTLPSRSDVISTLFNHYYDDDSSSAHLERKLQAKFSSLNKLFNQVSLKLPDAKVSRDRLELTITQLVCRNLNVRDIQLSHTIQSNTSQRLNVNIQGLKVDCSFRWAYKWTIFNGSGSGTARLDPTSSASVDLQFLSKDYNLYPPHDVNVPNDQCRANVQIADMDFDGDGLGIIGGIMNLFEGLLRDVVEGELSTTVCTELRGLGDDALDDLLLMLSDEIDTYLVPLEGSLANPLFHENTIQLPTISDEEDDSGVMDEPLYMNFQEMEEYAGEWINSALDQVDSFLGTSANEPYGQLGINKFIRDNFLNDNSRLVLDPSLFFDSGVIFEGHDMLTETQMKILSIQIEGLDSFMEMDVFNSIGKHTLQNVLKLDYLRFEVEMEAEIKASSKSNAVIVAPNSPPVKEKFTIDFALRGIQIDASIFLGINTQKLGNLELGSMLHTKNILPCLFSAIDEATFTGLSVTVADMIPPTLAGFLDSGIDHLVSKGAESLFHMYEKVLIKAMPSFFETQVRPMVNDFIVDALDVYSCPLNDEVPLDQYVDFRDLFLPPVEAAVAGASGDGRYGDVIPWVMNIVEDQLFSVDESGLLGLNDLLIAPLTKSQSGLEGALKVNGTLLDLHKEDVTRDIWRAFADNLRLTLSDLTIKGLDTLRAPTKLLEPRPSSAYLIENQLSLGIPNKPLDASVHFEIQVGDATSPLYTDNALDLEINMPTMDALLVLFATIEESRFMKFPLKDILNFSCWLSMIPASTSGIDIGLAMHFLDVLFDGGILATTQCVSCSNSWLEDLNSIVAFLDENNFINDLKEKALSIGRDLLRSNWVQGIVDKTITSASLRCPHNSAFGGIILADQTYPTFKGTRELVDGILLAGFPLVQVIATIIAQKHSGIEVAPPVEIELDVPADAKLIDLTDLSSVAGWADMALDEVRNYLGGNVEGSSDLGITSILKSMALDDNGLMTISIDDQGFEAGGVKLSLYDVTIIGLDSITMFDVLKASTPSTFTNSAKLKKLGVTLKMGLFVEDDSTKEARMLSDQGLNTNELETITVSLILKDLDLDASLLMAMDYDLMGQLKLGSILDTSHILFCMLSIIHSVGLSEFVMDIGDIEEFSISGFISEETNEGIQSMTEAMFDEYKSVVLEAIPAFTSNTVRPILHDILQYLIGVARDDGACPTPASFDGILDFRDLFLGEERSVQLLGQGNSKYGNLFRLLYSFLEDMMSKSNDKGLSKMNDLVSSLTQRQSNEGGALYYPGDLFKTDFDIALNGLNAEIELGVSDLRVSNIDSLGSPINVLQPAKGEPSVLDNIATIGVTPKPLQAELRLLIKGEGDQVAVHNDFVLSLSLESVDMMLELLAEVRELPFMNFPLQDILNLQCWLATVVTPALDSYGIRVGEADSGLVLRQLSVAAASARLGIECISCSSPLIVEMASNLGVPEAVEDTTTAANMIFEYLSGLLGGDFAQSGLDKMLNEAAMKCPHSPSYNQNFLGLKYEELVLPQQSEDTYGFLIAIISIICICVVATGVVLVATRCVARSRHQRWLRTLNRTQIMELDRIQSDEREQEKDLNSRMKSLVTSKEVPFFLRLFMPLVILGNIALFLSGHLSVGGTVLISGSFAGQDFNVEDFFTFSMARSTVEMWKAGARSLAILIVIFSGVWPYTKQLITLVIWFVPPRRMSSKRRGLILHWLDVLGKWSMIDVFVLLMTLASFRLSIESPDHLAFLPEGLYSINMLVRPLWGLYANMSAQLVAQISSHIIIHYHRKTTMAASRAQRLEMGLTPNSENAPEALRLHCFRLDYEASSKRAVVKKRVHWIIAAALLSLAVLVIVGCALPSFGIEVLGLVGLAVESGNQFEQARAFYSVFDLANMIVDQGRYLNTPSDLVGLGTLASLLVITVFLVPLAQAASLSIQWFSTLTKKQQMKNTVLNEILCAWQYMEVYVLSIIIASWQLGGVSEYMINAYCDPLQETFTSLSFYGILDYDDAQCFRVNASVQSASWVLVSASLILVLLNHFVMGASNQKMLDDDVPVNRRYHSDRWLESKQSTVTVGIDLSMSVSVDEENGVANSERRDSAVSSVHILPVMPRFTDYFSFAVVHKEEFQSYAAETAIAPIDENEGEE